MRIKVNQIESHLKKQGLSPIYLVSGDDLLLRSECIDSIRVYARQQGFSERQVLTVEGNFDWQILRQAANDLSLFAAQRLFEVHLGSKTPGAEGGKIIIDYLQQPPANTVLIFSAEKLDAQTQKSKWFSVIEEKGVVVLVTPIALAQLPDWIMGRFKNYGMSVTPEAAAILAERNEGYLLACAQEIEKLHLLFGKGHIEAAHILESVADNARFDIFNWVDTVLAGDAVRATRQFQSLRAEKSDPILVLWALDKEISALAQMAQALQGGQALEGVLRDFRVWDVRKPQVTKALKRHSVAQWWQYLQQAGFIDRVIKGNETGDVWDELLRLSLAVAGVALFKKMI